MTGLKRGHVDPSARHFFVLATTPVDDGIETKCSFKTNQRSNCLATTPVDDGIETLISRRGSITAALATTPVDDGIET